jgi:hypothetical protein
LAGVAIAQYQDVVHLVALALVIFLAGHRFASLDVARFVVVGLLGSRRPNFLDFDGLEQNGRRLRKLLLLMVMVMIQLIRWLVLFHQLLPSPSVATMVKSAA